MTETFLVNSGNVPPQSTQLLSNQLGTIQTNTMRRKPKTNKPQPKLKLDKILGLTSTSSNIMDTSEDLVAYAAGAVVVLYHHKRNKQIGFLYPPLLDPSIINTPQPPPNEMNSNISTEEEKMKPIGNSRAKPVSCLTFSSDGNYLAVGEAGHQPRIFIWDVKEKKILKEFRAHKFGVLSLAFSPNMRYLVSVGFQHDGYLYVWDWKRGVRLAGNKVTSRLNAISFSKDGSFFVTAGLRHVKFWYLDPKGRILKKGITNETQVLDGRAGLLGVLRDANFVDVACDQNQNHLGYTYFVTDSGILCSFKEGRVIDKWVDLQVKNSFSIAVSIKFIICTCSEGIIRLFEPVTLKYVGILPKPHPLGIDISSITSPDRLDDTNVYPDSVAIVYDNVAERITTVYSDRSLYMWDIHDLKKIGKYRSFIFHSDCVWGIEPCPNIKKENFIIPFNSFATFSGDGTIRVWNLDRPPNHNSSTTQSSPVLMIPSSSTMVSSQRRNIYSRELVKMIYVDKASSEFIKQVRNLDRIDLSAEDQYPDFGIRSLKMSPDGNWMASGDRNGNLRLHNLINWELMSYQEAHESEILSIDIVSQGPDALIATGSRDRLIHIFEMKSKNHQLIQTLDDHSSSITAVKFTPDATRLISSGADKAVIFRQRQAEGYTTFQNNCGRSTVFDMALNDRCVATVTGERRLYLFHLDSGKPFRMCKPDLSDEPSGGSLINIDLDPFSGTFAVTSGSDRCLRLFDLTNSSCVEKVGAHAEQITAVKFVRTNKEEKGLRVVSTCSDSTIFVWKISPEIVAKMCARAGLTEEKPRARIRRVSTAMGPSVSQNTRKTFSTMSTTEHKYDEVYRKIEANRRRPMTVPQEKKSNGNQKRNTTRPPPPPSPPINSNNNNKLIQNLAHMRQGRNPLERKNSVLAKRPSQPTLASDQRETKAVDEEEDKTNSLDEEEEDDDDDEEEDLEEEIIFTPEQEKVSKPFKVSTHVDTTGEEEDEERLNVSDTPEEEDLSESSGDDEAILRDITSLAPPRVTASRSIIRRSMPRKKRTKRQSFTAKFLSSLPALDANQIAHVSEMKQNDMSNTNQPDDTNQNDNVSDTNQSDHVSIINSNEPRTEMDPKLESALADLDGISILLDSVLDTLVNTIQTKENEKPLSEIKNKLNHVAGKIATQASSPPETIELLEKYSNLLLTMVQNKLSP